MVNVLITGGLGYVGTVLVNQFLKSTKYNLTIVDSLMYSNLDKAHYFCSNKKVEFIKGDIRDTTLMRSVSIDKDIIIHLAALVGDKCCEIYHDTTIDVNISSTIDLYKIAIENKVKIFLYTSTCSVYGHGECLFSEKSPLNPQSLYAVSKRNSEKALIALSGFGKTRLIILRFGTAFGISPAMRFDLLVNSLVYDGIRNGVIECYSPQAWRPYISVKDMVKIITNIFCLTNTRNHTIINVGSNEMNFQKNKIVEIISSVLKVQVKWEDSGPDKRSYRVDFNKLNKLIDFNPTGFEIELNDLINHLRAPLNNNINYEFSVDRSLRGHK